MKKRNLIILILAVMTLAATGCGTSSKRTLYNYGGPHNAVTIEGYTINIYADDHRASKKNADRLFDEWAEMAHLSRNITGKRLLSIATKTDGCNLTYDFRLVDGSQQRLTLIVPSYTNTYKKAKNASGNSY